MKTRISLSIIFMFFVTTNTIFSQNYETIKTRGVRIELSTKEKTEGKQIIKLSSSLDNLYKQHKEKKDYKGFAAQSKLELIDERVVVTILPQSGFAMTDIDENTLKGFGVRIQAKAKHSMRIEIPISQLENVATQVKGIGEIREPIRPIEQSVLSEGVALMNANNWQAKDYQGSGVKVAVIDLGFNQLTAAQGNGDIPLSYVSQDFTGSGLETGTQHGTAVGEAVYDVAPQAQLYFYKIEDITEFESAENACISNGVQIVNHSVAWFNTGGYYDGTGSACDIASDAITHGILWVNSAGNSAQNHYRAIFVDDGSGYNNFGGGANVNPIGPDPTHVWYHNPGDVITICMNWNNYPTTDQDYDLYLYNYTGSSWMLVASSTRRQNGSISPEEEISYVNSITNGMYGIVVRKYSATTNVDFTLFSLGKSIGYQTSASSLTDPATVTDVVTVGAIDRINYESGPQESFSSQGPTTDGRTKPDVAAPDDCNSYTYGYWYGTSLSSPHTVGVCALIKSRYPEYTNADIRDYLYTNCTIDLGLREKTIFMDGEKCSCRCFLFPFSLLHPRRM